MYVYTYIYIYRYYIIHVNVVLSVDPSFALEID